MKLYEKIKNLTLDDSKHENSLIWIWKRGKTTTGKCIILLHCLMNLSYVHSVLSRTMPLHSSTRYFSLTLIWVFVKQKAGSIFLDVYIYSSSTQQHFSQHSMRPAKSFQVLWGVRSTFSEFSITKTNLGTFSSPIRKLRLYNQIEMRFKVTFLFMRLNRETCMPNPNRNQKKIKVSTLMGQSLIKIRKKSRTEEKVFLKSDSFHVWITLNEDTFPLRRETNSIFLMKTNNQVNV